MRGALSVIGGAAQDEHLLHPFGNKHVARA